MRGTSRKGGPYCDHEILETTFTTQPNPRSTAIYLYSLYSYDPDNPVYYDALELEEAR
jgi:hypothetical protein